MQVDARIKSSGVRLRVAAIADFELAMSYLHKSARLTRSEVTGQVGTGLQDAWTLSRESLERSMKENGG